MPRSPLLGCHSPDLAPLSHRNANVFQGASLPQHHCRAVPEHSRELLPCLMPPLRREHHIPIPLSPSTSWPTFSQILTALRFSRCWQSSLGLVYFHRQLQLSNRLGVSTDGSKSSKELKKHSPGRKRGLAGCWTWSCDLRLKKSCSCIPCTP